jgi:hypothetical protein
MTKSKTSNKTKPASQRKPKPARIAANRESRRGKNPNSLANLEAHQFKPGQSGNITGRPKLLGESYKHWLSEDNGEGITNAEAVARAMGLEAMKGDVGAAREIRSATEGDKFTGDINVTRREKNADEMSDDELATIAVATGHTATSGPGTDPTPSGA